MSMILRSATASPFARKVRLAAAVLGLDDQITIEVSAPMDPEDSIRTQNPLSKIPALILNDGRVLYDSRVIIEYLDTIAGGKSVIPRETGARFEALTTAALADGILDASILIVYEDRCRPDLEPYGPWLDLQRGKIERGCAALAAAPPSMEPITVATIGVASVLGYLDFRKQFDWRAAHPGLIGWLDKFAATVPAFEETRPDA
jgi:glutathione S-transferase